MMHRKETLFVLGFFLAAVAFAGCSKPCCLQEYDEFVQRAGVPADLASNPDISNQRTTANTMHKPRTIDNVDAEPNYITLSECIAMAMEHGTVGSQSLRNIFNSISILNTGTIFFGNIDDLGSFNGAQFVGSDAVRAFALQPALTQTDIEASLARYDTVAKSFVGFGNVDVNPGGSAFSSTNGQFAQFGMGLEKALPTGGVANITFGNTPPGTIGDADLQLQRTQFIYQRFSSSTLASANGYTPDVRVGFTQPLLKFFGPEINSLLTAHPLSPSQQLPGSSSATAPPIVLARINFNQSRAEFERLVNYMVLNVEAAYYQLYALYVNLYSTEQAMRQSYAVWNISKSRFEAGNAKVTDFAQTRTQYEDFSAQRIQAVSKILEQERILRLLCGLPVEDGKRLVPVDVPTLSPFLPDGEAAQEAVWESARDEALRLRPELTIAREDIKRRQLELVRETNNLLPDVRLEGGYSVHGFGTRLDGDGTTATGQTDNAFRDLAGGHFGDYNLGIFGSMPLGLRAQHAAVRADNIRLMQAYIVLRDQEDKAINNLVVAFRAIDSDYKTIIHRRAQREAAAVQVDARTKEYLAGKVTVDFLLTAQQQWAAAFSQEYQAITNYNLDLAAFQFSKGTILQHDGIQIAEGPLPHCVQVRAVENERQRAQAIVLRERAAVVPTNGPGCPDLPVATTPSLPALMMDQMSKDRVPDKLEEPAPVHGVLVSQPTMEFGSAAGSAGMPAAPTAPLADPVPPPTMPTAPGPLPASSNGPVFTPIAPGSGR